MRTPTYTYDQESDTISVMFRPELNAMGIEVTDHILLYVNKVTREVAKIIVLEYSLLVQETVYGPRAFPLTGLAELTEPVRDMVLDLLREAPSNAFLQLIACPSQDGHIVPMVCVQPVGFNADADDDDHMLPEYDFSHGVRGKHAGVMQQGYSVVITTASGETVRYDVPPPIHKHRTAFALPADQDEATFGKHTIACYEDAILLVDQPDAGLIAGDLGTVVAHHNGVGLEPGYSVEFFDGVGHTVAVVTVPAHALRRPMPGDRLCIRVAQSPQH